MTSRVKSEKMILGCGSGRVLRATRRRYGVRTLGFDVNPLAYITAKAMCLWVKGIEIRWGDFWAEDLMNANVIFCYLFPDIMGRLTKKLETKFRPGSRVVLCLKNILCCVKNMYLSIQIKSLRV